MDKKDNFEEEGLSKEQTVDFGHNPVNDEIEVIPYEGTVVVGEEVAVTYGPDPMIIEQMTSNDESDIIFLDTEDPVLVDVDSDMYGGPLPEDFYRENLEITELTNDIKLVVDEDIESDNKDYEKKSDSNYFDSDDFIC